MFLSSRRLLFFFFNDTATTEIYTLSLHDALPICRLSTSVWKTEWKSCGRRAMFRSSRFLDDTWRRARAQRSEEHTSELQSQSNLVCRLLLEKKKKIRLAPFRACRYIIHFVPADAD